MAATCAHTSLLWALVACLAVVWGHARASVVADERGREARAVLVPCEGVWLKSRCVSRVPEVVEQDERGVFQARDEALDARDKEKHRRGNARERTENLAEHKNQVVVQMVEPMPKGTLRTLRGTMPTGTIVQYMHQNAYLLYAGADDIERLKGMEQVESLFALEPEDKVAPELMELLQALEEEGKQQTTWWDGAISAWEEEYILEQSVNGVALDDEKRILLEVETVVLSPADLESTLDRLEDIVKESSSANASAPSMVYHPTPTDHFVPGTVPMIENGARVVDIVAACWPADARDVIMRLVEESNVLFVEAKPRMRATNQFSVGLVQGGQMARSFSVETSRPIWDAGIRGNEQVAAVGDTGLDYDSCFFRDDEHDAPNPNHRKVIDLRVFGDGVDNSGHGTHVAGSVLGYHEGSRHNGVAPDAKIVFTDMGIGDPDDGRLLSPINGLFEYYEYAHAKGARVQSDSWGGNTNVYTSESRALDEYLWTNDDYLVVIAAGNSGGLSQISSTVTTPANSKNGLAIGATLGSGGRPVRTFDTAVVRMEVKEPASAVGQSYRAISSVIGPSMDTLLEKEFRIVLSSPQDACSSITSDVKDKLVLIQRGNCPFSEKIRNAQEAGAAGTIVSNNEQSGSGAFYVMGSDGDTSDISIPSAAVPESTGRRFQSLTSSANDSNEQFVVAFTSDISIEDLPPWESVAEFSSFGPTVDGRVKPDLVAPGQNVVSAGSDGLRNTNNCDVSALSGTSMATPLVGGAALLVRQYFTDGFYKDKDKNVIDNPSGALIKAVLINGAVEMQGFTERGLPLEQAPSFRQGYGRVDISNSIALPGRSLGMWVRDRGSVFTGDVDEYCIQMPEDVSEDDIVEMRVTLVWMDPPANILTRGQALINDLDLEVEVPAGAAEASFGSANVPDRTNNVERAFVYHPDPGASYKIRVRGHSVNFEKSSSVGQPYALVVTGPAGLEGSTDFEECPLSSRARLEAAADLQELVATSVNLVLNGSEQLASAWGRPQAEVQEEDPASLAEVAELDPCTCSSDGVSGGVQTDRPYCDVHIDGEEPFCYVTDPLSCESATPSEAFEGASWRECSKNDELEVMCPCSADGISGGNDTGVSGCQQLLLETNNDQTYYCYVKDPATCSEDQYSVSEAYSGAGWRECNP